MVVVDVMEGELVEYEFIGVNIQDLEFVLVVFSVSVNLYDVIDIGGIFVFDVNFLVDGIILVGIIVKFVEGCFYYLVQFVLDVNIFFEEGFIFQIEVGVIIYLQAGVDMDVMVFGMADICGIVDVLVVMISENVLCFGVNLEVGDWNDFQIEGQGKGINSGFVQYLCIEYVGDWVFVLDDVGNGIQVFYVQVWQCIDEVIFIVGGDVNVFYFIVINFEDI